MRRLRRNRIWFLPLVLVWLVVRLPAAAALPAASDDDARAALLSICTHQGLEQADAADHGTGSVPADPAPTADDCASCSCCPVLGALVSCDRTAGPERVGYASTILAWGLARGERVVAAPVREGFDSHAPPV